MEKSLMEAKDYESRAYRELNEAKENLKLGFLESAASTAYYSSFCAVHSQLSRFGILAKSHRQTGVELQKHFISSGLIDKKYSKIWVELFQWRQLADYTALSHIDKTKARELVNMAEDFVTTLLKIK